MKIRSLGSVVVLGMLSACGGEASTTGGASGSASGKPSPPRTAIASTSGSAAPGGSTKPSASPTTSSAANASGSPDTAPPSSSAGPTAEPKAASLDALFDGPPDAAIKMGKPFTIGKATLGAPDGWSGGGVADSVDALKRGDGASSIVVIRLDISEAYLDMNVAQWVKVPFATDVEVKWEARIPGKIGVAHLDAKLAKGAGKIGKDDADFFQAAVQGADKKYPLVVIAGVKKAADPGVRAEMTAALKSLEWK